MNTQRLAMGVCYDGKNYHGWQIQEGILTVQGCLEKALSRVANHPVAITCAGRTDAGVHATEQVFHFDTTADRTDYAWVFGANSNLPHDMSVHWTRRVNRQFHARFSALSRHYRYVIYNHSIRPGILRHAVGWCYWPLDPSLMEEAGQFLIGEHDFSAYRGADCQSHSSIRSVSYLTVHRRQHLVIVDIIANAFLLHMVRNIVGVLITIGSGEKPTQWARDVLDSRDRRCAGVTMAPNGLYLVKVQYPEEFHLPQEGNGPFFL